MGTRALRRVGLILLRQPRGLAWVAPALWMGLLWWSSSRPSDPDSDSGPVFSFIWNLGHAPAWGLLALFLLPLLPRAGGWIRLGMGEVAWILLLAVGYGVADELHQAQIIGRHASGLDVVTDLVGAGSVLWVVALLGRERPSEATLRLRLLLCLGLCLAAAGASTFLSGSG